MSADDVARHCQRANDAELEAAAWKETAARWRKRALQRGGKLRRLLREASEQWSAWEERAEAAEDRVDELEDALAKAEAPLKARVAALEEEVKDERQAKVSYGRELAELRKKMGTAGSVEALVVERDALKSRVDELQHRATQAVHDESAARMRAHNAEKKAEEVKEKTVREVVLPAKARIRVVASRLGIGPSWPKYSDDDALTEGSPSRRATRRASP